MAPRTPLLAVERNGRDYREAPFSYLLCLPFGMKE
jgi:hypothetical protein